MATFSIDIDATPLFFRSFIIPGASPSWVSSNKIQTFNLQEGIYNFQFASGYYADFTFEVTAAGTIAYPAEYRGFLRGAGSNRLTLVGLAVRLDARYLGMGGGAGVLLADAPMTDADWILCKTVQLLPGLHYRVQQGSGLASSFSVQLQADGMFNYHAAYDIASGGFLAGAGTSTLTLHGYPFLIDATHAGGMGLQLVDVTGIEFADNAALYANLLPMLAPYRLLVNSGAVTDASFVVNLDGTTVLDPGKIYRLARDRFQGVPRIRVS